MKHIITALLICSLLAACNAPVTPTTPPPAVAQGDVNPAQTEPTHTPTATFSGIATPTATFSGIATATPSYTPTVDLTAAAEANQQGEADPNSVTFTPDLTAIAENNAIPEAGPTTDLTAIAENDRVPEATAPLVTTTLQNDTDYQLCGWYVVPWFATTEEIDTSNNRLSGLLAPGESTSRTFYGMSAYFQGWNKYETCTGEVVGWQYIDSFELGGTTLAVTEPEAWMTVFNVPGLPTLCGLYATSTDPDVDPNLSTSPDILPENPSVTNALVGMPTGEWELSALFCGSEEPTPAITVTVEGDFTLRTTAFEAP